MSLNVTANIRCLDPQFAGGPDAQSVASYTQQTRHAVTVEERVPIYDGRAAAGFRLFDVTAPESEQAEARRQQQRCGYTLARKVWTVPEQAIVQIQNPSKARDDGSADRDGEVPGAKQQFFEELAAMVCRITGAKHCAMTAWSIRDGAKRGKEGNASAAFVGAYSFFSHSDFTPAMGRGAWKMFQKRVPGYTDAEARNLKFSFMNVWKPTARAVEQFPLAVLDWRSCAPTDCHEVELGYALTPTEKASKGGQGEARGVAGGDDGYSAKSLAEDASIAGFYKPRVAQTVHRPDNRWVYFPAMCVDEALVFTQYDQRFDERHPRRFAKHTFHTAFFDESAPESAGRRSSIEVRFLCAFEEGGGNGADDDDTAPPQAGCRL
jgi:hypothetical protein